MRDVKDDWPILVESPEDFLEGFGLQGTLSAVAGDEAKALTPYEHNLARADCNLAKGGWASDRAADRVPSRPAYFASPAVAQETCDLAREAIESHVAASPGVEPFVNQQETFNLTPEEFRDWTDLAGSARQASGIAAAVEVAGHGRGMRALSDNLFRQADVKRHDTAVSNEEAMLAGESRIDTMRRAAREMVKGKPEDYRQAKDASQRVLPECMHSVAKDVPSLFPNSKVEETALEVAAMGKGRTSEVFAQRLAGLDDKDYTRAVAGLGAAALTRAEQEGSLTNEDRLLSKAFMKAERNGAKIDTSALAGLVDRLPENSPARALCATAVSGDALRTRQRATTKARDDERVA